MPAPGTPENDAVLPPGVNVTPLGSAPALDHVKPPLVPPLAVSVGAYDTPSSPEGNADGLMLGAWRIAIVYCLSILERPSSAVMVKVMDGVAVVGVPLIVALVPLPLRDKPVGSPA